MAKHVLTFILVVVFALSLAGTAHTQDQSEEREDQASAVVPLRVEVVISRFQGDTQVSRLPYTMSVNADGIARFRLGTGLIYTRIDCTAMSLDDGKFRLSINIDESTAYADDVREEAGTPNSTEPVLRGFQSTNSVVLVNGKSAQLTAGVDKINGEVVKVDVTLTVLD